jgi:7-keto-8-aminopelargonate synthetase-like enzyme
VVQSPIVPVIVGGETAAVALAARLYQRGCFIPAIRFPTVARDAARLRVTLSASHSEAGVRELAAALRETCRA